jgi:hypothetical protein
MAPRIKGLPKTDDNIAINYRASPTFQKFHNCPDMFRGICGPIGVGKTVGCEIDVLDKMIGQEPDKQGIRPTRFAFIRSTYPELISTTMKTWSEWVPQRICPIRNTAPITATLTLPLPDGTIVSSEIIFLACDRDEDVKKLKSLECTGIFINEASEINRSIFEMAIGRTLGRYPPKKRVPATWYGVIADTNPPDDEHWWYEYAEIIRPKDYKFFRMPPAILKQVDGNGRVTYAPNDGRDPTIPACENVQHQTAGFDYWMKQIPGKTEDWIRVYLMGEYGTVSYGKPVYARYRDTFHATNEEIKPYAGLPIVCGWDFGLTPTCVIGQLAPNGRLIFLKEFCAEDCGLRMFAMGLVRPYLFNTFPGAQIFSIGDPAGSSRSQTDESTCIEILAECGIPTIPCWTNALMARIEAVSYFLDRTVDGGPGMLVGPGCPKLRKGFAGKYLFKYLTSKKDNQCAGEPDKGPYSHPHDAAQYLALLVLNPERIGMNASQYGRDNRMAQQSGGSTQGSVQAVGMDMSGYS